MYIHRFLEPIEADSPENDRRRAAGMALCLFVLLFAVYLLTYSGVVISTDERGLLASIESLVKQGDLTVHQLDWYGYVVGSFEPAQVFLAAPLYRLALAMPDLGAVQTTYLFNILITALTGMVVLLYTRRLGYPLAVGVIVALLYGLDSMAWVYTRFFFREPLAALCLLTTAYFLQGMRPGPVGAIPWYRQPLYALLTAGAYALAVMTKEASLVALPIFLLLAGLYLAEGKQMGSHIRRRQMIFVVSWILFLCALGIVYLAYNLTVLGSASLGTRRIPEAIASFFTLTPQMWSALLQMPFSPGKGLFTHSPIFLAALFSLPLLWRRRRYAEALLPVLLVIFFMCAYATDWVSWWGGVTWGPRYFVPLLPFLAVALAPTVEHLLTHRSRILGLAFLGLVSLSFVVQVGGVAVNLWSYINYLVATGATSGSLSIHDPGYSEILGHLRLLRPENLDFAWVRLVDGELTYDFLIPILTLLVAAVSAWGLWRLRRYSPTRQGILALSLAGLLVPVALAGIALPRYYDDPRYHKGKEWFTLLESLHDQERPGDVLILNQPWRTDFPTYTDFFLNYSQASLPWYGMERDPWPPRRVDTLSLLTRTYRRIWLASESTPEADQFRGMERWLAEHAFPVSDTRYGPAARLQLFVAAPWPEVDGARLSSVAAFGEGLDLLGAQYPIQTVQAGDVLPVALFWRAKDRLDQDYSVTLQLLDNGGQVRQQIDRYPVAGFRPTTTWQPGEIIGDHYGLLLPADLPAGRYRLAVAWYQWMTMKRLSLAAPPSLFVADDLLLLGEVAVGVAPAPPLPYPVLVGVSSVVKVPRSTLTPTPTLRAEPPLGEVWNMEPGTRQDRVFLPLVLQGSE